METETFTPEENEAWEAFAQALPTYTLDDMPHPDIYTYGIDVAFGAADSDNEEDGVIVVRHTGIAGTGQ